MHIEHPKKKNTMNCRRSAIWHRTCVSWNCVNWSGYASFILFQIPNRFEYIFTVFNKIPFGIPVLVLICLDSLDYCLFDLFRFWICVDCWLFVESLFKWIFRKMHFRWLKPFLWLFKLQRVTYNFNIMKFEIVKCCDDKFDNKSKHVVVFILMLNFKWMETATNKSRWRLNPNSKFKKFIDFDLISYEFVSVSNSTIDLL